MTIAMGSGTPRPRAWGAATPSSVEGLFSPAGPQGQTTLEMQGMLFPSGNFSWDIALGNYNILFFVAPLMIIGLLIYIFINKDTPQQNLVLIWSIIMLAATLGQRRFGYYLAVNMAILGGYAIWWSLRALEPKNIMPASKAATAPGKTVRRVKNKPLAQSPVRAVFMALCGLVVIIMALLYDIPASASIATQTRFAPTDAWSSAMAWMKDNTPEPLGSKDAYYQNIPPTYQFPASAYGVTSWWDYGYWITRMAHRIPTANPGQSAVPIRNVARLYLSQNETAASEVMSSLKSSYVVLDFKTATSIFWAIAVWGGHDQSEYTDVYYTSDKQDGRLGPVMVYYPEYYRTLVSRLYNFDGKAVIVEKPLVVTYKEVNTLEKAIVKQVVEARSFNTYIDAQAYMAGLKGVKARIVSNDPFVSPVALEELKTFKKVYSSPQESTTAVGQVPEVKIFQFVK